MVRRQSFELDPASHPLAPAIIAFNRGNGWYRAVLGRPDRGEWSSLTELSSDTDGLERRLATLEKTYGGHPGYAAAALIQQAAHPTLSLTAWCVLLGAAVPDIDPDSVWLRQHPHGLFDRVAIDGGFTVPLDTEESAHKTGTAIVSALTPLIESIRRLRTVGVVGLWRGVNDLVARTFLGASSSLGSVSTGMAAADAILTRAPEALRLSPRWYFADSTGMWFSLRSVCCLAYTGTSGTYCDTCPLLDDEEIWRRLALNQAGEL